MSVCLSLNSYLLINLMKYLFLAYSVFEQIIKYQPMMTGCYQWIRVFDGDARNWKDMNQTKEELEEYDVIQINADPMDMRLLLEVRRVLGWKSHTKIVLNQDHAPELWDNAFPFIAEMQRAMDDADYVFATSPYAQELMQTLSKKYVHLIPHPCETHVLKRMDSFIKNDHLIYFWHRYDHQMTIPYLVTKDLKIPVSVAGYDSDRDKNNKVFTKVLKWNVFNYFKFPDFAKFIKEAKVGYDPFNSYSYGRTPCDCAALGLPLVCSEFNYSARICFPYTCVNPFDAKKSRILLKRLLEDSEFYEKVKKTAFDKVEYFNHNNSKEKYMFMIGDDYGN